jgi:hypothetical protein
MMTATSSYSEKAVDLGEMSMKQLAIAAFRHVGEDDELMKYRKS